MKNTLKTALFLVAFGTTAAFANGNTPNAATMTLHQVLPVTISATEKPVPPKHKRERPLRYSPEQKAKIVELELNSK